MIMIDADVDEGADDADGDEADDDGPPQNKS